MSPSSREAFLRHRIDGCRHGAVRLHLAREKPREARVISSAAMSRRKGDYDLDTAHGRKVHLDSPDPDDICLDDIASALSKVCRFGAQPKRF